MNQKKFPCTKYAVVAQFSDNSIFPWASALVYRSPIDGRLTSLRYTLHGALDLNFSDKESAIRSVLEFAKVNQFVDREYIYSIIRIDRKSLYSIESFVVTRYSITYTSPNEDGENCLLIKEV